MTRKVIVNLVVSLILFPPLILIGHWGKMLNGIYRLEDAYYPDFISFIKILLISTGYPIPSLFFLFLCCSLFNGLKIITSTREGNCPSGKKSESLQLS